MDRILVVVSRLDWKVTKAGARRPVISKELYEGRNKLAAFIIELSKPVAMMNQIRQ